MTNDVWLTKAEMQRVEEFCIEVARTQQTVEFGQSDFQRDVEEVARDSIIGRVAEVAFKKWAWLNFHTELELDWGIYPRGVWDAQDAVVDGKTIDIKGTRSGGKWLMVETNKIEFRKNEGNIPDYFVFITCGWDRDADRATRDACVRGFYEGQAFVGDPVFPVTFVGKGDPIPGKSVPLMADNKVINRGYLRQDWEEVFGWLNTIL